LQNGAHQAVAGDDVIDQPDAGAGFDEQRGDGPRKEDDVGKAETGRTSGSDREEMREGASGFGPVPRMLINSVSGEVIVASVCSLDAAV